MPPRIVRAVVRGQVQGVGFRAWAQHQGQLRGLDGWVRNRRDGTVEVLVAGPGEAVEAMLDALKIGPATGRVDAVAVEPADFAPIPPSGRFEVLPTA